MSNNQSSLRLQILKKFLHNVLFHKGQTLMDSYDFDFCRYRVMGLYLLKFVKNQTCLTISQVYFHDSFRIFLYNVWFHKDQTTFDSYDFNFCCYKVIGLYSLKIVKNWTCLTTGVSCALGAAAQLGIKVNDYKWHTYFIQKTLTFYIVESNNICAYNYERI